MFVCKFGGTSLADAAQIRKVGGIINASTQRKVVVVSAPGKRSPSDEKITDILFSCHAAASRGEDIGPLFETVRQRYTDIAGDLGMEADLSPVLDAVEQSIRDGADHNAVVSRGEYLSAHLVAGYFGYEFVDAAELIRFADGRTVDDAATDELVRSRLASAGNYVVPGFYGAFADGRVQLFSRGGSDISAALLARALEADLYENWTDVSGLLSADPRIVPEPEPIDRVSYRELRELAYLGAAVFHQEAVAPVEEKGIPIRIRNTDEPDHEGTLIAAAQEAHATVARDFIGVAGKIGFRTALVTQPMLSRDARFVDRARAVCADLDMAVRHAVSGSDTLLLVCPDEPLSDGRDELQRRLEQELGAASVDFGDRMAVVGAVYSLHGVPPGRLARMAESLDEAGVGVRYVSVGESPHTAVFGVDESRYEEAVRAVYRGAR
ncbi:MAG: aspartate kinase [Spirochaetaceae bacterium]